MYQYDPKRYKIAPWRGRFGDQAHAIRVSPHRAYIQAVVKKKQREIARLQEQIRQLEVLSDMSNGTMRDGVLVRELDESSDHYAISFVAFRMERAAKIYPNASKSGLFGLYLYYGGYPYSRDENRGWAHTKQQAIDGARAWVLRSERQPKRYDRKDGSIREEP